MSDSAGLVLYRWERDGIEVLIGHMGGPYFAKKDEGGWTFPKGLVEEGEAPEATAVREFAEELGQPPPRGHDLDLGSIRTAGKSIRLFAREGQFVAESIASNTFELEWPPRSGQIQRFPELDRATWVPLARAEVLLAKNQQGFIERIREALLS